MIITKKTVGFPTSKMDSFRTTDISEETSTVYRYILECNKDNMDGLAFSNEFVKVTFEELFRRADHIADLMQSSGIKKGDSVMTNILDKCSLMTILLACSKLGVQNVVGYPLLEDKTVSELIDNFDIKMFLVSEVFLGKFAHMNSINRIKKIVVLPMGRDFVTNVAETAAYMNTEIQLWNDFLRTRVDVKSEESHDADSPFLICGTSGTTGIPKLFVHTNGSVINSVIEKKDADMQWKKGDSLISSPPPFVISAITCLMIAPLACGVTVISNIFRAAENGGNAVSEKFDYEAMLKYNPDIFAITKTECLSMISQLESKKIDLGFIKHILFMGEAVNIKETSLISRFLADNNCFKGIENIYGMSELTAFGYHRFDDGPDVIKCRMLPHTFTAAFDPVTNEECPYGVPGILHVRSCSVIDRYINNEELTNRYKQKDQDGNIWACTGDLGYIDENGYINPLGRYEENYLDQDGNRVFPYMISEALMKDDNFISCRLVEKDTENGRKIAIHVQVKKIPENAEEYVLKLHEMLKDSEQIKVYPDMYKIRTSMPIVRGKTGISVLRAETDGFISIEK